MEADEEDLPWDDLIGDAPETKKARVGRTLDEQSMFERSEGEEEERGDRDEPPQKARRLNRLGGKKGKQWKHWEAEMEANIESYDADLFEIFSPPRVSSFMRADCKSGRCMAFDLTMNDDDG